MKPFVIPAICLIVGLAVGAGGMFIYNGQFGGASEPAPTAPSTLPDESTVLPPFKVRAPIVTSDGTLATYAVFTVQLAVAKDAAESAPEQVPMILNAINMRTYETPLAKGVDGKMPSLRHFHDLVSAAAKPILGQSVLAKVMVTDVSVDETGPL